MRQVFDCLNYCSEQRPDSSAAVPVIMSLVQQASDIYLRQLSEESSQSLPLWPTSLQPASSSSTPLPSGTYSRPLASSVDSSTSDSILRLQHFKETLEAFPHEAPGGHVLIWATFIAASDCILEEHKAFFETALLRIFVRNGFVNVLYGLDLLRKIWAQRSMGEKWTSILPQTRLFIM
jgi:hypothetical protein